MGSSKPESVRAKRKIDASQSECGVTGKLDEVSRFPPRMARGSTNPVEHIQCLAARHVLIN